MSIKLITWMVHSVTFYCFLEKTVESQHQNFTKNMDGYEVIFTENPLHYSA